MDDEPCPPPTPATPMIEEDRQSLCEIPRGLVVGGVNETFVCGICKGFLREPRRAGACEHLFCRVCKVSLSTNAYCSICKQPVDASEPLQGFGPFEAMVNSTVVRCPHSTAAGGEAGCSILQDPAAKSSHASGSSVRSLGSVQAPGVDEEAGDGGSAGPRAGGTGESGLSSSTFNGVCVSAPPIILSRFPGCQQQGHHLETTLNP